MIDTFCLANRHTECMAPDCACGCHALPTHRELDARLADLTHRASCAFSVLVAIVLVLTLCAVGAKAAGWIP